MRRVFLLLSAAAGCFLAVGCHDSKPVPAPAPTPQPASASNVGTNERDSAERAAPVQVNSSTTAAPNSPPPDAKASAEIITRRLRDLHFEYNQDVIRREDQATLADDASLLQSLLQSDPSVTITIEGHCDDRGSPEYNMALADRRANAVRDNLIKRGVPGDRLNVVSYGEERPLCLDATEECYGRNRRAHFRLAE